MKKTINFFFLLSIFLYSINLNAQWNWLTKSSATSVEYGWDASTDASGNSYLTGGYLTSATFGSTTLTSSGQDDAYLTKINASGVVQWAVKAGGSLLDQGLRVVTNGNDVYMAGTFRGTITFSSTNAITTSLTGSNFNDECFIAKYNASGVVQWAVAISGANSQRPWDLELNSALSRVYVTGEDNDKTFINCYSYSTGSLVWSKVSAGTTNAATGFGIAVDQSGSCYSIAKFNVGNYNIAGSPSYTVSDTSNLVMMKLDQTGTFVWGQQMGLASTVEQPRDIDIDAAGNLYVSGKFESGSLYIAPFTLTNSGNSDLFVAKFPNAGGNATWVKKIGGSWTEYPTGQCVDAATGNLYVSVKNVEGNTVTIPGTCFTFSSAMGVTDRKAYVVKYNTNGDVDWAIAPTLSNSESQFNGISLDANKNVIASGSLVGTGNFGTISATGASSDGFVTKLQVEPSFGVHKICSNQSALITPIGPSGLNFNWYATSTSTTPLATGPSFGTSVTSTTTYYVSTILPGGCQTQRVPVTVTVLPIAVVNAGPDQTICAGSCASINFTSSTGGVYITDNTTNVTTGPFFTSPISLCPTTTTTYTFKNTPNPNYCKNVDQVTITVNPSLTISSDFDLTGTIPLGSTLYYTVTANVPSVPAGSSFSWEVSEIDNAGNIVPNTTLNTTNSTPLATNWLNPVLNNSISFPGYDVPISNFVNTTIGNGKFYLGHKYRITRGTWGPCTPFTTTSKVIYLCTGCKLSNGQAEIIVENSNYAPSKEEMLIKSQTRDFENTNTINAFPNPTTDIVNFIFNKNETGKIDIYSFDGKLVFTKYFKENNQLEVSLKQYQSGIYTALITTNGNTISKKIVKE